MNTISKRMDLGAVLLVIGAAAAVLGTAKTMAEAVTGRAFSLGDLAYYTGNVALVGYECIAVFGITVLVLLVAAGHLEGRWKPPRWAELPIALLPVLAALVATVWAVRDSLWDPDVAAGGYATFVRLVGIAAVVLAVIAYRRRHGDGTAAAATATRTS